ERWRHGLALPSIILLDLKMPIMDGFEFLEGFEGQYPRSAAIYVVTGSASDPDRMRALSFESVRDYIVKPVMGSDIIRLLMVAGRGAETTHANAAGQM
ncbi:MAG: response regulator, partial [Polyangiales bacterium]